ncbi:MAG: ribose 5-phosphate isomerase B [Oscillospiraceae bacterium]|nr:ribose 5-phosphate isomerase B [Oscillospiraceae bacterium]MBQ4485437.1 ribose 5-phosphate isomerase B [Oscillospiraceae bacterium]MCR5806962.1 ribose 5-phosphate isomerase B [Oscillospiraceae bacterium]
MIIIGSDHGGYELRKELAEHLREKGFTVEETGSINGESVDYPNVAEEVCGKVISGEAEKAVLICGTGIGISIAANKIDGIRAALCTDCYMAKYTRLHNNANVLCLGGRVIGPGLACEIADTFFSTDFEGGRHQRRIDLISALENK